MDHFVWVQVAFVVLIIATLASLFLIPVFEDTGLWCSLIFFVLCIAIVIVGAVMDMSGTFSCEVCGKDCSGEKVTVVGHRIDLCDKCQKKLENFIKEGEFK